MGSMRFPGGFFFLGAVFVARIAQGVAPITVAIHIQEDRAFAFAAEFAARNTASRTARTFMPLTTSECMLLSAKPAGAAGDALHAHDFVVGAVGHAVMVVADQENNGQAEFAVGGRWLVNWDWAAKFKDSSTTPLA